MAAARAKKRRASSPAKKTPAKKSGHGGARVGAGRKQEKLPEDLLKELGNPPEDPLEKRQWWNRLLEVLQYGLLKGKPWLTMLREARANALAAARLVPEEIKDRAAQLLEQEDRETEADASPKVTKRQEDRIAAANAGALRRDPT